MIETLVSILSAFNGLSLQGVSATRIIATIFILVVILSVWRGRHV
ncbi:MAG TPA: hypothetical protein VKC60_08920 [Opitutaceae bacterium]|nr:hypothetical protein [Opitutaceae bacterium]